MLRFPLNSVQVTAEQLAKLDDVEAHIVKLQHDGRAIGETFVIELHGHTDPTGNEDKNDTLSQRRADEVAKALVGRGISRDLLRSVAMGSREPVRAAGAYLTELNRRVTFHVIASQRGPPVIQKKICMVGAFGVGKTSLVSRFVHSIFSEKYQTTVGVKIDRKIVPHSAGDINLILWDLAGEDALTTVRPAHLKGASGYILVIDGLRRTTLEVAIDLHGRVAGSGGRCPLRRASSTRPTCGKPGKFSRPISTASSPAAGRVVETSAKTGAASSRYFVP